MMTRDDDERGARNVVRVAGTYVVVRAQVEDDLGVDVPAGEFVVEHGVDGFEARGQDMGAREQERRVQESIFEVRVAGEELLTEKGRVGDVGEQGGCQRIGF